MAGGLSGDNRQYTFGWTTDEIQGTNTDTTGVEHVQVNTPTGWRHEMKLPWMSLQGKEPQPGDLIGIDCFFNDDDDGGDSRETQLATYADDGGDWQNPVDWGTAILVIGEGNIAYGPSPSNGALHRNIWAQLTWKPGPTAVSHDLYIGDSFEDVNVGTPDTFQGNHPTASVFIGFSGNAFPDGLVAGTTYYWRIDEVNDANPDSPWKGYIWSFSTPPRTAFSPNPADGAEFVEADATFTWEPGMEARLHTFYLGDSFEDVNSATIGRLASGAIHSPGPLEAEKVLYWRVDETNPPAAPVKGDVWSFTTTGAAGNPQPANGANAAPLNARLAWTPADTAASHHLYFGTDADAVRNATSSSLEYVGNKAKGSESHDPGKLAWDTDYFWRVDAAYTADPGNPVKGLVWAFRTADFIGVDDFESYNDIAPPNPASNTMYSNWVDGFQIPTNGALTSNEFAPYAEQTIVHGGAQSMKYVYDTNFKICESTLTLVYPRDWTDEGVTELSLWFVGKSSNTPERMFVELNGMAVVYHDDPAATQITGWEWIKWVIDLQEFADRAVDLTNVSTITIGFGTKGAPAAGGTGQVYFDDIQLNRPAAETP